MVTFLFWNINQKPLENLIVGLVEEHQADVLMLAESEISHDVMLKSLNRNAESEFHLPISLCEKVFIYTRFRDDFIEPVYESTRITIRRLMLPARNEVLLVALHFPDKLHSSEESQKYECTELAKIIRETEDKVGHQRTLLVGDLNMNPFESGVVAASGLHAVMTREVALRRTRIVGRIQHPFFYNPMWGRLGDSTDGPPGTYYYTSSEQVSFFWNTFDQVLVRPDLLEFFRNEDIKVLTQLGDQSFLSPRGLPKKAIASDHLPILFKLNV